MFICLWGEEEREFSFETGRRKSHITLLWSPGEGANEKTSCPIPLWGEYVYTLTDTTGSSYCNYNSYLDICDSTDTLSVNTTLCSSTVFYSSE